MNNDDRGGFVFGFCTGVLIGTVVVCGFVKYLDVPKAEVIERGAAYYHPQTGEFTWKEQETNDAK